MSLNLTRNGVYRQRVIIDIPSWMAPDIVLRDWVKSALGGHGFTDMIVTLSEKDVPVKWPEASRPDVSAWNQSQAWVEATWSKKTGLYASQGDRWRIYDYWLHKAPPESPPICKANGLNCKFEGDCCSGHCDPNEKVCAEKHIPSEECSETNATCADDDECCSGQCIAGFCRSAEVPPKVTPVVPPSDEGSNWPLLIASIGVLAGAFAVAYHMKQPDPVPAPTRGRRTR